MYIYIYIYIYVYIYIKYIYIYIYICIYKIVKEKTIFDVTTSVFFEKYLT